MADAPSPGGDGGSASPPIARLSWIDNLRTLMIVLVVNMHACVTYSHVGGWYVMEGPSPALPVKILFIVWQGHLQAFFMGLLFFLAGVFAHLSIARRGPAAFLRERARRLGLPSLLYMLLIHPVIVYVLLGHPQVPDRPPLAVLYTRHLFSGRFLAGNGPMWFALALLVFSAILAGACRRAPPERHSAQASTGAPGTGALLMFGAGLVAVTFLMRIFQPLGTSVLNFQLGYFPQYIAGFAAGVLAGQHGWLETLAASRQARVAGWCGLVGGPLLFTIIVTLGGPPPEQGPNPYVGGWNLRAFALAAWEQLAGLGLALGLLAWFYRHGNASGPTASWLSHRAFAVYLLHAPVLVFLTPLLRPAGAHPLLGTAMLTVTGLITSFVLADLAKRVPGLRSIV